MGVTSLSQEYTFPISPSRMFKALIVDSKNLIPKLLPEFIKSVHTVQGDGEPGSIEQVNFTEGSSYKYAKHQIDEIDEENLVCKYTMIEGDALGDNVESIAYEVRFEAASSSEGGGCICKMTSNYRMIGDSKIKEEEIKASKERVLGIYKLVENHLLNNPQVYA